MNKSVLIIGRFQPIHLGHLNLIERYHKAGFFIKIGIGSVSDSFEKHNPLSTRERRHIVKLAMEERKIKNYKIFNIPDVGDDNLYVQHVLKIVGRFNTIVTGNSSVLKPFLKYEHKNPWNIEYFREAVSRPGGNITSGMIRKKWQDKPSRRGILKSTFQYLKKIGFSKRLRGIIDCSPK